MAKPITLTQVAGGLAQLDDVLRADTRAALDQLARYQNHFDDDLFFFLKVFVLTFHTHVNTVAHYLRTSQSVLPHQGSTARLSENQRAELFEYYYDLEAGHVTDARRRNTFLRNLRLGFNGFSKVAGIPFALDERHPNWMAFRDLMRLRNAIAHPSGLAGLIPLRALTAVHPAAEWFFRQYQLFWWRLVSGLPAGKPTPEPGYHYHHQYDPTTDRNFDESAALVKQRAGLTPSATHVFLQNYIVALGRDLQRATFLYTRGSTGPDSEVVLEARSPFAQRALVRMLVSVVEALTAILRWAAKVSAEQEEITLREQDRYLLACRLGGAASFNCVLRVFPGRLSKDPGWLPSLGSSFDDLRSCRDRITHPRWKEDLEVSSDEGERIPFRVLELISVCEKVSAALDRLQAGRAARQQAAAQVQRAGCETLSEIERRCYEDLATFPEGASIPVSLLQRLYALDPASARSFCRHLHERSLLLLDRDGEVARLPAFHRRALRESRSEGLSVVHLRLLDSCRPDGGWARLPIADSYLWQHLAHHLVKAGLRDSELRPLLLSFEWLAAKLRAVGTSALLADYDHFDGDSELRAVQGALRLSAHVLDAHPEELAGQLRGRLLGRVESGIVGLLEQARQSEGTCLRSSARLLTPPGGPLLRVLAGHSAAVTALAVLADGRVVSAATDDTLRVWDVDLGTTLRIIATDTGPIMRLAALPNDSVAAASEDDPVIRIWDLASGEIAKTLVGHSRQIRSLAVLPDARIVSASDDDTLRVWNPKSGETLRLLKGHEDHVAAVAAFSNHRVISASADETLRSWDVGTGTTLAVFRGHSRAVDAVATLPAGRVVSSSLSSLRFWESSGKSLGEVAGDWSWITDIAVLGGNKMVSGGTSRVLQVWDVDSRSRIRSLEGHTEWVTAVIGLPDGRVVSAADDHTLLVWDVAAGKPVMVADSQANWITALACYPEIASSPPRSTAASGFGRWQPGGCCNLSLASPAK